MAFNVRRFRAQEASDDGREGPSGERGSLGTVRAQDPLHLVVIFLMVSG